VRVRRRRSDARRVAAGIALVPSFLGACAPPVEPHDPRAVDDIAFFGVATSEAPRPDASSAPPSPELQWLNNLTQAQVAARVGRRKVLVWFHADWSSASLALQREVWTRPDVRQASSSLVPLRLDLTAAGAESDGLMAIFAVDSVPAILVVDDTGRVLGRVQGVPEAASIVALVRSFDGGRTPRP